MERSASLRIVLTDKASWTSLILQGYDLQEPVPEHPVLGSDYDGFSYYGHVCIQTLHHWGGVTATISTEPHTGRGQTKFFDKIVGPRIAALRLTVSREMREIMKATGACDTQELDVHFTPIDLERIRDSIQTCADDIDTTFFAYRNGGVGRYDVNNRLIWGRG